MSNHRPLLELSATEGSQQRSALRLLQTMLDLLPVNVVIADADGRIVHANASAAAMLAAGDPIWSRYGRLSAMTSTATTALNDAIASTTEAGARVRAKQTEVALPRRDGRVAIAHVRPLARGASRVERDLGAAAALFITEADRIAPSLDGLARLFELTPAETRVLEKIASGMNRKETAAALGLADSTVKTHLENIYAKTGAPDRSALCRLAANLCWPEVSAQR
ncbi:MAG: response regulator transcription factor [Hyphomicrobium sp.]